MKDFFQHFNWSDLLVITVLRKLIGDNLPNLNWKNILRFLKRVLAYTAYVLAMFWLALTIVINWKKTQQLALVYIMVIVGVSALLLLYSRKLDAEKGA